MFMATLDFALGEDIAALREMVRGWAQERLAPMAAEIDRKNLFPAELWREMGELGLLGITVPEEYGGRGPRVSRACHCGRGDRAGFGKRFIELWGALQPLRQPDQAERQRRAEGEVPAGAGFGRACGGARHVGGGGGVGRGFDEASGGEEERQVCAQRHEVLDHQRAGRRYAGGLWQDRPGGGGEGDHGVHRREDDEGVLGQPAFRQARDARVEHGGVDLRGCARCRSRTCWARRARASRC